MSHTKFEIGTVYTNIQQRNTPACIVAGWKCISRKVSVRKNARWMSTRDIITARFVRVDSNGKEFGSVFSMRVSVWGWQFEQCQSAGKFNPYLRLQASIVVANAAA